MQSILVLFVLTLATITAAYPLHYDDGDYILVYRIRRHAPNDSDSEGRGTWRISGNTHRSTDSFGRTQQTSYLRGDAGYNLARSQDGKSGLYGTAHYQRNFGDNTVRQQYGLGLEYGNNDRGSIGVGATQYTGKDDLGSWRNTNVRADANYDVYRSRDGNTRVSGKAYYEKSFGDYPSRGDFGGGVTFTHNF